MSVVSSILFEVNGESYSASINNLIEVCRESESMIQESCGELLFPYRGEFLECFDLRKFFNHGQTNTQAKKKDIATFCIVEINSKKRAFRVSKVKRHTDIVVKEMTGYYPEIDYINGVSILATGEPLFVISLSKIYQHMKEGLNDAA